MKKSTAVLVSAICLLGGCIILGFLIAPVKEGIGNHCGNTTSNHYKFSEEEYRLDRR